MLMREAERELRSKQAASEINYFKSRVNKFYFNNNTGFKFIQIFNYFTLKFLKHILQRKTFKIHGEML